MANEKASNHADVKETHTAVQQVFKTDGLLDQAQKAQATPGGLASFFQNLWTQFSPVVVPALIALISQLLHLTPATVPVPPAK